MYEFSKNYPDLHDFFSDTQMEYFTACKKMNKRRSIYLVLVIFFLTLNTIWLREEIISVIVAGLFLLWLIDTNDKILRKRINFFEEEVEKLHAHVDDIGKIRNDIKMGRLYDITSKDGHNKASADLKNELKRLDKLIELAKEKELENQNKKS